MLVLSFTKTLMLNNVTEARAEVKLDVIKFVADERKSGKESTTVGLF
jgi:hypothetical protein